jgi:hypothetical protein
MLSKINPAVVAQCWYLRRHVPAGRRRREVDGVLHCTCRYCERPIRSRDGERWDISDGIDLDALADVAPDSHFCVVDTLDDMVIARYPVPANATETAISEQLCGICETHGVDDVGSVLQVRLIRNKAGAVSFH